MDQSKDELMNCELEYSQMHSGQATYLDLVLPGVPVRQTVEVRDAAFLYIYDCQLPVILRWLVHRDNPNVLRPVLRNVACVPDSLIRTGTVTVLRHREAMENSNAAVLGIPEVVNE